MVDAFTSVVGNRIGCDRARVGFVGGPTLAQRVLRAVLLEAAIDQRQLAVFVRLQVELGKGLVAAGGAVVAVAVGVHARGIEHKAHVIGGAFSCQVILAHAVAADQGFGTDTRWAFAVTGEHLNHPSGVAAVKGCGGAAQHFDTLGSVEVERGRLTLAIRSAGRDAIGDQLDAAYAKGRTGAKASGRNLQVLGVVLAVLHHQPWHAGQYLGRVNAQLAVADLLLADAVDRIRQVKALAGTARAGDDAGIEFQRFGQRWGRNKKTRQQQGKAGGYKKFHEGYGGSV